jgi:hypothetical protein
LGGGEVRAGSERPPLLPPEGVPPAVAAREVAPAGGVAGGRDGHSSTVVSSLPRMQSRVKTSFVFGSNDTGSSLSAIRKDDN